MNESLIAVGLIALVAIAALWITFRDSYTDLKKNVLATPVDGPGTSDTTKPAAPNQKTYQLPGGLTLSAGLVGKTEPTEEQNRLSAEFDRIFERNLAQFCDVSFRQKIVGVKHLNRDGKRRTTLIKQCAMMDPLRIEPEPDNPVDPQAVAILREDGSQLGYLEARTAHEIYKDFANPGFKWVGFFEHHNFHPETGRVVGGVFLLARRVLNP